MPISDDSVNAFMSLDEGQQRSALSTMSPESKSALLQAIQSKPSKAAMVPPAFQPKVPDPISGLEGEGDTSGITVAAPPSFLTRVGERVKQNVNYIPTALDAAKNDILGKPLTPEQQAMKDTTTHMTGGENEPGLMRVAKSAVILPRMVYDMGKSWTQDPANAVGDIVTGFVTHQATNNPNVSEEAVPPKLSSSGRNLTPEAQAKYTEALDKANSDHAAALEDFADKEATARAKWVQKTYNAKQSVVDQVKATNKKEILSRGADEYTKVAQQNIQDTHNAVRSSLDNRWNGLRDAMQDATVPANDLYNAVQEAKAKFLRGSPADLSQFNALVKELGIDSFVEGEDGQLAAAGVTKHIPWDTARVHSSAIGRALSKGNLPGNVYHALDSVRTAVEDQLGKSAELNGQGPAYQSVRKDWSQYMNDWQDTSGVKSGGSPLAHALNSTDPGFVGQQVMGQAGDRMISTLAKYKKFGGRPDLLASARSTANAADAVKIPSTKATPAPYEAPEAPELKEVKPPKPEPKKAGKIASTAGRLAGKVVGGTIGHSVGHPLLGYGMGGELGSQLADRLAAGAPETSAVPSRFRIKTPRNLSSTYVAATAPHEDADSKAVNDANQSIEDFIKSLPQ